MEGLLRSPTKSAISAGACHVIEGEGVGITQALVDGLGGWSSAGVRAVQ